MTKSAVNVEGMSPWGVFGAFECDVYRVHGLSDVIRVHQLSEEERGVDPEIVWALLERDCRAAPVARLITDTLAEARLLLVDTEAAAGQDAVRATLMDRPGLGATWVSLQLTHEAGEYRGCMSRIGWASAHDVVQVNWNLVAEAARMPGGINSEEPANGKSPLRVPLMLAAALSRALVSVYRPGTYARVPQQGTPSDRLVVAKRAPVAQ